MKIPYTYAAPCAKPFTGDNGGATADGVTADSIKIVVYIGRPGEGPAAGGDRARRRRRRQPGDREGDVPGLLRPVRRSTTTSTAASSTSCSSRHRRPEDEVTARADANAIADMHPFAVMSAPNQTPVWSEELAANSVMCLGNCSLAVPREDHQGRTRRTSTAIGPTPEQAGDAHGRSSSRPSSRARRPVTAATT